MVYLLYQKLYPKSIENCILFKDKNAAEFLPQRQRVKKVVIPSQCSHWRGNLPDKRNIFDSENVDFPNIWGIARR